MIYVECSTPSITTGHPLKVRVYGESLWRRLLLMPYIRAYCYSVRITDGGWKWRKVWFRKRDLQGYPGDGYDD